MRPVEDHDLKTQKAKYIHSLIEEAKSGVAGASEDTTDFYSQWLQGDVKKHLAFMSLARRDGDMNGIRKQAELAQESSLEPMRAASRCASTLPKPLTLSSSACLEREDHESRW